MVSPVTKRWTVAGVCQEWFACVGVGCLLDPWGEGVKKELMAAGARRKTRAVGEVWESSDSIYRH